MIYVNLIESVRQVKNQVEVVATVQDESGKEFLGISDFFLTSSDNIPEDEDELSFYLEDMNLQWDLYIPIYDNNYLPN